MGAIIGLLVSKGLSKRAAQLVFWAGAILTFIAAGAGVVAWIRHDAVSDNQVKMERRAAPATDKAANERASDAIRNAKTEEELHNVIAAQPDQPISPTSRALACRRLSNAGKSSPACSGLAGGR